jgi:S-formylglutathione hydrolase FrmB
VLADYRRGYYTDRGGGPEPYFPASDFGDRAKRLLQGSTGAYESAVIPVIMYVEKNYPTTFDRVLLGQGMGGYGAVKLAIKNPSIFLGAASQSGHLNLQMYSDMYPKISQTFNMDYPEVFDVFGPGTFNLNTGPYPLPQNASVAFNDSYLTQHNPTYLLQDDAQIYIEVETPDKTNPLIFNSTVQFCAQMVSKKVPGATYVNSDGQRTLSLGRVFAFLSQAVDELVISPPDCTVLVSAVKASNVL